MPEPRSYPARQACHIMCWLGLLAALVGSVQAQPAASEPPRVFIDCDRCYESDIRQAVPYVGYVRDRLEADVHVLVTRVRTGGGGREYTLRFLGQRRFAGVQDTLTYVTLQTDTDAEERNGLIRHFQAGLMPFVARTPVLERLAVLYEVPEAEAADLTAVVEDPWNFWVFDIDFYGFLRREETQASYAFGGSFDADRITEAWAIRSRVSANYDRDVFEQEDGDIVSTASNNEVRVQVVKSLSPHWSAGLSAGSEATTFRNIDRSVEVGPAVEYNVFPYAQSTQREFTFAYRVEGQYVNYIEETLFDETEEWLTQQSLTIRLERQETWGNAEARVSGSHYFHDISKNSLDLYGEIEIRLFRGFAIELSAELELINDQLYLARGDAPLEEILLRRRQLSTGYEYSGSIGLSYTFGSIYNNVVNTRL